MIVPRGRSWAPSGRTQAAATNSAIAKRRAGCIIATSYPAEMTDTHALRKERHMVKVALWVRLEAKPGREAEVEQFLKGGLAIVQEEPKTVDWFAIRMGPTTFGIFDTFDDDSGRDAHLSGKVAAALMAKAPDLLAKAPEINKIDVIAAK